MPDDDPGRYGSEYAMTTPSGEQIVVRRTRNHTPLSTLLARGFKLKAEEAGPLEPVEDLLDETLT